MKYALLFPGQGSQRVGMGMDFHAGSPDARALFKKADDALGYSLSDLCFKGPDDRLRQTIFTQPALYVTSCAAMITLQTRTHVAPYAVAGHSVGEYAALFASGSIGFEKGLELVSRRAELMQQAAEANPGTMAAVLGLDAAEAQAACEQARTETGSVVVVANYNSPGQVVISGLADAVELAGMYARQRGAKRVIPLPVSGAFHSPLMVGAGDALYPSLRDALFQNPKMPIVSNVTADYTRNGVDVAPLLTMQVSGSVRWEESMQRLLTDGVRTFIEIGSGEVLAGLMKRIDKDARTLSVQDMASLKSAVALIEEMNTQPDDPVAAVSKTVAPGESEAAKRALEEFARQRASQEAQESGPAPELVEGPIAVAAPVNRQEAAEIVAVAAAPSATPAPMEITPPVAESDEGKPPAARIYHITRLDVWQASLSEGAFRPPSLAEEGFIHASRPEQITQVGNNLFRARSGLVLVEIDAPKVHAEIRYEKAENGRIYPHIYGPVNVDAIVRIINFPVGPDGRFTLPVEIAK